MPRHRNESTTSECSSEGAERVQKRRKEGDGRSKGAKRSKHSPIRYSRKEHRERSESGSSSHSPTPMKYSRRHECNASRESESRSRSQSPVNYNRRRDPKERSESRSRSRSPYSPVDYRRGERKARSHSRSRSRSRSSTPARYERHLRQAAAAGRGRGGFVRGGRGGYTGHPHHHHHHHQQEQPVYGPHPFRGGPDGQKTPPPSRCLSIFGMPPWVREKDLRIIFDPYGELERVNVIVNRYTGDCKGFGFIYYQTLEEAKRARNAMSGNLKIDNIPVRVDYSLTEKPRPSWREREGANP